MLNYIYLIQQNNFADFYKINVTTQVSKVVDNQLLSYKKNIIFLS